MNIVFMGTPDYATTILDELVTCKDIDVKLVLTQPDKPVGRKQVLTPPHVKNYILNNNLDIEIYQPLTLKSDEAHEKIKSVNPDFIVVAAYGQILPKNILEISPCINLHASLLPKYRGASPIQSSILNNDEFSGVTAMLMEEGLDSGDILGFSYIKLDENILVGELFDKLSKMAAKLTVKTLKNFENISPIKQIDANSSYAKKISKTDGLVDFTRQSAKEIFTKFRAFTPWPGVFTKDGLKLKDIELVKGIGKANTIIGIDKDCVIVTCKSGALKLKKVQPSSKKEMNAIDYIRGKRLELGNQMV
jgi:methionyl-tRNA formyltransferase